MNAMDAISRLGVDGMLFHVSEWILLHLHDV